MGMEWKSLKWEEIGTKNLFPHISTTKLVTYVLTDVLNHGCNKNECSNIMMIDGSVRHA